MSIQVGIGISTARDHLQAARDAISQARINLGTTKVDLAIVFSSTEFAHPAVLRIIRNLAGSAQIIGVSSLAVIYNKGIYRHALLIILLSFPETIYFNTAYVKDMETRSPLEAGQELGDKLSYGFKNIRRDLGLIFCDGLIPGGSDLLYGLQRKLGSSFPLVGASASDNLAFKKTYVYSDDNALSYSACGVIWGGRLDFGLGIKHGWKPLGKPRHVTKSSGNIVYEIDGLAATRFYQEYFSFDLARFKNELKRISIFYPIGLYLPGAKEYLLRNVIAIEANGALGFQGNVPQGSLIRLMISSKESCLNAAKEAAREAKKSLGERTANFALVLDSASRYILLGRQAQKELGVIKEVFGETPVIGIYTYGEEAPLKAINYQGKSYLHNQSIAILAAAG